MTVWFTSDTHYGHRRVLDYAERPFESVETMDEALIDSWNAAVRPNDTVYHLGDFALTRAARAIEIARRLRGRKHLVFGNHDNALRRHVGFLAAWVWARDLTQIIVCGQKITLCHYAMRTWASAHHGAWQLHGHSHGTLPDYGKSADVGVDCRNYSPVAFETLVALMASREARVVGHHTAD